MCVSVRVCMKSEKIGTGTVVFCFSNYLFFLALFSFIIACFV